MKHFGLDTTQSRRVLVQLFPRLLWDKTCSLRARLLDEEVPLLGVVKQLGSVIDVAEETIELRNFQNSQLPLEVVAGHLTMDLQQSTPQMWEQARQGQEAAILHRLQKTLVYHPS